MFCFAYLLTFIFFPTNRTLDGASPAARTEVPGAPCGSLRLGTDGLTSTPINAANRSLLKKTMRIPWIFQDISIFFEFSCLNGEPCQKGDEL